MNSSEEVETKVEVEEEIEGDHFDTTDYFFERIGEAVPVKPQPFHFDPQAPPSQPLAVSELHGLVFVALPSGGTDTVPLSKIDFKFSVWSMKEKKSSFILTEEFGFCIIGFCVARTKDVIGLALESKETGGGSSSIQELSVADVPLSGNVHILALSFDNFTLAASVAHDVHFFHVNSLVGDKVKLLLIFFIIFLSLLYLQH